MDPDHDISPPPEQPPQKYFAHPLWVYIVWTICVCILTLWVLDH